MFDKKIASKYLKVIVPRDQFPMGTKWVMNDRIWTITEVRVESATELRKCQSTFGNEEIVTLATLRKDMESSNFRFIDAEQKPAETETLKTGSAE